jgi:hypothetical protein
MLGVIIMSFFLNNDSVMRIGVSSKINATKLQLIYILLLYVCASSNAIARDYELPPSISTSANVPWISDAAMEQCVTIYNEAQWLEEEINGTAVNQYSQAAVDAYNSKITRHSELIDYFNQNCAGKQSESAYRAAQKLNQQQTQ